MKIIDAKCKNCGAELKFDSGKTILFCPYCGTKLLLIDGDEVKAEKARSDAYREVELAREETEREKNRQEHEREKEKIETGENVRIEMERLKAQRKAERERIKAIQREGKERLKYEKKMQRLQYKQEKERNLTKDDKENRVILKVMLGFACAIAFCIIMGRIESYKWIHTPDSSKNCVGKQYEVVEQQFKDAGFSTVRSEAVEDLYDGFLHNDKGKIGTVKQISVNGEFDFEKDASYTRFSPVVVYYHVYPDMSE